MKKAICVLVILAVLSLMVIAFGEGQEPQSDITAGGIISFGKYEQDNDPDNGTEPIEWIVLDVQDGKALLLSKYGLDMKQYESNKSNFQTTWEECSLRAWLNGDFIQTAFSEEEQNAILVTEVDNSASQSLGGLSDGNNTQDRVFLLSYYEAHEMYFSSDEARICSPTDYAIANGVYWDQRFQANNRDAGQWWLRSPRFGLESAMYVYYNGDFTRNYIDAEGVAVRPALWLNLESNVF